MITVETIESHYKFRKRIVISEATQELCGAKRGQIEMERIEPRAGNERESKAMRDLETSMERGPKSSTLRAINISLLKHNGIQ